ncbi:hypothetical protein QAD02_023184 [Eretmocerus hayati]|uniref:Uncharacterized protein n=1 Tax=Eretmocerus hayati TaxID=131215 RepID=A0ACC2Q007_9HYME|nr:hypothetical protein QAD02_023184 [Eretmocerus hayati]
MSTSDLRDLGATDMRRQFFQWTLKWFYEKSKDEILSKSDLPTLVCLLQAVGFKLQEFEKSDVSKKTEDLPAAGSIRISVECGTSKMMATLQMDEVACECPSGNDAKEGSFWSISGTGPLVNTDNVNRIEETGSNLLPQMSKETTTVVRDVVQKLCKLINNKNDEIQDLGSDMNILAFREINANPKDRIARSPLVRSRTEFFEKPEDLVKFTTNLLATKSNSSMSLNDSPSERITQRSTLLRRETFDLCKNDDGSCKLPKSSSNNENHLSKTQKSTLSRHGTYDKLDAETNILNCSLSNKSAAKIVLGRQETFDMNKDDNIDEPRKSIEPRSAIKSPNSELLTASFGQLSLQSEEEILTLGEYVVKAHQILESAISVMTSKLPRSFHSSQSSIPEEAQFLKPITPPPGTLPMGNSSFLRSPSTRPQLQHQPVRLTRAGSNLSTMSSSSGMSSASRSLTSRSASGASSGQRHTGIPSTATSRATKKTLNGNGAGSVGVSSQLRDRSSSFNSAQRPQIQRQQFLGVPGSTLGGASLQKPAVPLRRNSTTSLAAASLAKRNLATGSTAMSIPQNTIGSQRKSPVASKLLQSGTRTTELTRTASGVSRIKAPDVTSKLNTRNRVLIEPSKFGFAGAKK